MIPYRSILIVGGGTAGWLAAAYLQRVLGRDTQSPAKITLIESDEIETIGVGEATVPTIIQTLRVLDIPEAVLFAKTEATLKNGIRFVGWRHGGGADTDRFDHPFDVPIGMEGYPTTMHWLNLKQRGLTDAVMCDATVVQTALMDHNLSPKLMASPPYEAPIPYGYHLDATLLAKVLCEVAMARGVQRIIGNVTHIEVDDAGIKQITLADGSVHQADLYVDCTGFRSLLLGGALQVPWVSFSDSLLCDRAVACPVAYDNEESPLRSYTTSTAKDAGWIWEIDLQSRRGSGYVFSSAYCSDDQAIATLRQHHGDAAALREPRLIPMRIGHHARVWEKNCLALGLASGFIEPLESTGIYLVEQALQVFVDYLPSPNTRGLCQARYNAHISELYAELRDFILIHYTLSQRRDTPFWRAYTQEVKIPDHLANMLALWEEKVPTTTDLNHRLSLFGPANWFFILAGMHRLPRFGSGQPPYIPPEVSAKVLSQIQEYRKIALAHSPKMRDYAKKVRVAFSNAPTPARP